MTEKQVRGVKWVVVTAVISGVAVFANSLVVQGVDPLVHTTVKNGLVGLMIGALLLATRGYRDLQGLSLKVWGKLVAVAVIGGSVSFAMFFTGLKMVGGAEGAMIHKTLVLWVALLAIPLLREKVSGKMALGIALLYGSNFVGGFEGFSKLQMGHGLVLGATLLWAIENVVAKKVLAEVSANVVVVARMGLGSVILIWMTAASGKIPLMMALTANQWLMLLGVAILLFGYVMSWYRALKLAPVTVVAGVLVGASVITNVLNGLLVTGTFNAAQLGQAGVILTGIWLVVMAGKDAMTKRGERREVRGEKVELL